MKILSLYGFFFSICFKQETEMQRSSGCGETAPSRQYVSEEDHSYVEPGTMSSSSSGCAISALTERQQMVGESSNHNHNVNVASYTMLPGNCDSFYDVEQDVEDIDHHYRNNSEMGETESNSYVSSYMNGESFHIFPMVIVPESFEEQMMMAMAVSLAEVHATTTTNAPTEVSWQ